MGIIKTKDLVFEYIRRDEEGNVEGITKAVDEVSLNVEEGDFVAIWDIMVPESQLLPNISTPYFILRKERYG